MAQLAISFVLVCCVSSSASLFVASQPALAAAEQESVYRILQSVNSGVDWRTLFPGDLCSSAPHGVVCDYFSDGGDDSGEAHVTEISLGYVSDYSPNPSCDSNSSFDPFLLKPLSRLKKLFFYRCFALGETPFPDFSDVKLPALEELVFIENPALVGSLEGKLGDVRGLRKLVLTGSGVSGGLLSGGLDKLVNLEQLTLSRNSFQGQLHADVFQNMKKLKVLDLAANSLAGNVPDSIGNLTELLKLDLSFNGFSGRIPENLKNLKTLELLDLSHNQFRDFGMPPFLSEMDGLKELHLSGNLVGGRIPATWRAPGSITGLGMSAMGLVGCIPKSMAQNLRNLSYLLLDNNRLEGSIPEELDGLRSLNELNLENNRLSGKLPFSSSFVTRLGGKLKVDGNPDLCIEEEEEEWVNNVSGSLKFCRTKKKKKKKKIDPTQNNNSLLVVSSHNLHALMASGFSVSSHFWIRITVAIILSCVYFS